jgi:hypothetical protein
MPKMTDPPVEAFVASPRPVLCVLDPARGARVLTLDTDGSGALLQVSGLVDDETGVGVGEMLNDVVAKIGP